MRFLANENFPGAAVKALVAAGHDVIWVKVLNSERVRFEVAGGNYRLVAAFDFRRQIAFVKFIGTHAEYDRIDALKVSQF